MKKHTIQIPDYLWEAFGGSPMAMRDALSQMVIQRSAVPPSNGRDNGDQRQEKLELARAVTNLINGTPMGGAINQAHITHTIGFVDVNLPKGQFIDEMLQRVKGRVA